MSPAHPSVAVITPTWDRHDRLFDRCIPSVEAQDYEGEVVHVVASDGPDAVLAARMNSERPRLVASFELDERPVHDRWGTVARRTGATLAISAGFQVIAYLDDDNAYRPDHLRLLVDLLVSSRADWAYSMMQRQPSGSVVGESPPKYAQLDTSTLIHRAHLLGQANWRYEPGQPTIDWDLAQRWLEIGATWAFLQQITVDYYQQGH